MNNAGFGCRDELTEIVENRLLQGCVGLDCCHEDGEMSLELVSEISDGGVVFRELLFCVDQVPDVGGDEVTELVEWHEWGLDVVGLVGLLGHRVLGQCTLGGGR